MLPFISSIFLKLWKVVWRGQGGRQNLSSPQLFSPGVFSSQGFSPRVFSNLGLMPFAMSGKEKNQSIRYKKNMYYSIFNQMHLFYCAAFIVIFSYIRIQRLVEDTLPTEHHDPTRDVCIPGSDRNHFFSPDKNAEIYDGHI